MEELLLLNELDRKVRAVLDTDEANLDPRIAMIDTQLEMVMFFLDLSEKEAKSLISWAEYSQMGTELQVKLVDLHRYCRLYV